MTMYNTKRPARLGRRKKISRALRERRAEADRIRAFYERELWLINEMMGRPKESRK